MNSRSETTPGHRISAQIHLERPQGQEIRLSGGSQPGLGYPRIQEAGRDQARGGALVGEQEPFRALGAAVFVY